MSFHIKTRSIIVLGCAAIIAGCSATISVTGGLTDGSETFAGNGEAAMSRTAPFNVTSSNGANCSGAFQMESFTAGTGTISCNDGRTGTFDWQSQAGKMIGNGTLSGQSFNLTMG